MIFYAIVKAKHYEDDYHFMKASDYNSKKDFLRELRANGYTVRNNKAYTEEEYEKL